MKLLLLFISIANFAKTDANKERNDDDLNSDKRVFDQVYDSIDSIEKETNIINDDDEEVDRIKIFRPSEINNVGFIKPTELKSQKSENLSNETSIDENPLQSKDNAKRKMEFENISVDKTDQNLEESIAQGKSIESEPKKTPKKFLKRKKKAKLVPKNCKRWITSAEQKIFDGTKKDAVTALPKSFLKTSEQNKESRKALEFDKKCECYPVLSYQELFQLRGMSTVLLKYEEKKSLNVGGDMKMFKELKKNIREKIEQFKNDNMIKNTQKKSKKMKTEFNLGFSSEEMLLFVRDLFFDIFYIREKNVHGSFKHIYHMKSEMKPIILLFAEILPMSCYVFNRGISDLSDVRIIFMFLDEFLPFIDCIKNFNQKWKLYAQKFPKHKIFGINDAADFFRSEDYIEIRKIKIFLSQFINLFGQSSAADLYNYSDKMFKMSIFYPEYHDKKDIMLFNWAIFFSDLEKFVDRCIDQEILYDPSECHFVNLNWEKVDQNILYYCCDPNYIIQGIMSLIYKTDFQKVDTFENEDGFRYFIYKHSDSEKYVVKFNDFLKILYEEYISQNIY